MSVRWFVYIIVLWCTSFSVVAEPAQQIALKRHSYGIVHTVALGEEDMRWFWRHRVLTVGTWSPDVSPIVYEKSREYYRGLNADYLALMEQSLHINVVVRQYQTEQEAREALVHHDVDTLLTPLSQRENSGPHLLRTAPLISAWPTLVTSLNRPLLPLTSTDKVTIACVRKCAFMEVIQTAFPNAMISLFDDEHQALSSVMAGDNQYFIGNNITTSHSLSKYFSQSLVIAHYFPRQQQHNYFVTRDDQRVLHHILDRYIGSIGNEIHMRVMQNWLNRGNLSYLNTPLSLTRDERQVLSQHQPVTILVNPDYPPYTLVDRGGELRGILGDLLNIIQLQTGLTFTPVLATSASDKADKMAQGGWDITPVVTLTDDPQSRAALSDSLLNISFVLVASCHETLSTLLKKPSRIAVPAHHALAGYLQQQYPDAIWIPVDDTSGALTMIKNGTAEGAITTELSARYIIDHNYPHDLHYMALPDMPVASVSFAIAPDKPVLESILNKAIQGIPPREILQMTEKWSKISNVRPDAWKMYSKRFYKMAILALLLMAISLAWGGFLSREVRKRRHSQRLLEEQLALKEALSHELEAQKDKAIQATEAKSRFLASMSHELRTPVSSIVGFIELLAKGNLTEQQRQEAISATGAAANSLLGLIGKILDVDKIESGKYTLAPQWTDLSLLLNLQCHAFDILAKQKGIRFHISNELREDERVLIDPQALRQVLNNLLGNALKFTEQGCIHVSATLTPEDGKRGRLVMTVRDTGCGISAGEQAMLFQRYAQGREGRQHTGAGLGLVISRELITLMGGELALESYPSRGTVFTVALRVETARQSPPLAGPLQQVTPEPVQPLPSLSILIADDHPTNRLLLKHQLNAIGYDVDEASDGEEAEAMLQTKPYDLLITDINMPKKDGLELARAIRRRDGQLHIWGLTASALAQSRDHCLQSGMDRCLFKPVSLEMLTQGLREIAGTQERSRASGHLNLRVLHDNTGGDRALLMEILDTFRDASASDVARAERALGQHQPQAFLRALHRLHGSAQILGMTTLQALCAPFEGQLPDCLEREDCQQGLRDIQRVMQDITGEIEALLQA